MKKYINKYSDNKICRPQNYIPDVTTLNKHSPKTAFVNGPAEPETVPMFDPELYQNHKPTYIESKSSKDRALYSMDSKTSY